MTRKKPTPPAAPGPKEQNPPQNLGLIVSEKPQSGLYRLEDAEQAINTITGLPQVEHDRRIRELSGLWLHGNLGKPKDMELSTEFLLLMVRAGKSLTPAQHDQAMDYIVANYQYFPSPAQYHAASLGIPVASLLLKGGKEDMAAEETELWSWYRHWAPRLAEGYRITVTLSDGSIQEGVTQCGVAWLGQRHRGVAEDEFCRVRVEMPPQIPALLELIFLQMEPTVGKAIQRMLDYIAVGDEYFRAAFRKMAVAMITRREQKLAEVLTAEQIAYAAEQRVKYLERGYPVAPEQSDYGRDKLQAANQPRVYEGFLTLGKELQRHSPESLEEARDEAGDPIFTAEEIENHKDFCAHYGYLAGIPFLVEEKIRLQALQEKKDQRAAELAKSEASIAKKRQASLDLLRRTKMQIIREAADYYRREDGDRDYGDPHREEREKYYDEMANQQEDEDEY